MTKITMAQLSELSGAPEVDLHNWIARLPLATKYERAKTGPARAGRFSRENALELTMISRLIKDTDMPPSAAAARVRGLLNQLKQKKPGGYVLFFGGNVLCSDSPPSDRLLRTLNAAGVVVNVGQLSDEIEEFFDDVAGDEENG